jgi:quercetin dioxygenase-like cupin family protein
MLRIIRQRAASMSVYRVDFASLDWQEGRPGVRWKVYAEGGRQIRLVEFKTSDGFDDWCEQGHIGYVLAGALTIEIAGRVVSFTAGDALFLPAGSAAAHRARSIDPGTRLLMVEDVA